MALFPRNSTSGNFAAFSPAPHEGLVADDALRAVSSYMMEDILIAAETREGVTSAGVIADAILDAITAWLVASVGPEAAYATLARHADEAAAPLLSQRSS